MELKNLVVIGQGAPNQLKNRRQGTCVCAWSIEKKDFLRIYPVPLGWLRRWNIFDVEVEENPQDHRENTWKIKNSRTDWKRLKKWIKIKDPYPKSKRKELIESIPITVLSELIKNKRSFGLIKPKIKDFQLEKRREHTVQQTTLKNFKLGGTILDEGYAIINQKDYKYKPYIIYECEGNCECKNKLHRQQIIEWGCYEFMRKNPGSEENIKENLRLFDDEWEVYLLLGNIHKAPQTYIIIDILRFKKKK